MNTLKELVQALASDSNHATTVFNQLATKATTAYVDGQLASTVNISDMGIALSHKHPTITSTTDLAVNHITTKSVEPPSGTTYLQLRTNAVRIGIAVYALLSSARTSFWTSVYISQGQEVNAGLTVGYNHPIVARFTVDAANGNLVAFGTI